MIVTATVVLPVTVEVKVPEPPSEEDNLDYEDWQGRVLATVFAASELAFDEAGISSIVHESSLPCLEGMVRRWCIDDEPFSQDEEAASTVRLGSSHPPEKDLEDV